MNSAMVVPLTARDRTLGAMTFVWADPGRQYTTRELELAEELGRRAGLALDHARLFAREHATAETLQRALLPAELPELPGFELVVRYLPSDARDHAGGDWYDAFRLPGRALRDRDRRRRRARDGGGRDDGPDPQLAARLRAQGRRPGRGDRRPARLVDGVGGRDHVRHRRLRRARPGAPGACELASAGPPAAAARARRRRALRRHAALPAARLQRCRPVHARRASRSRRARRCGCSPTGSSSRAGGRSTSASPRSPTPPAAPRASTSRDRRPPAGRLPASRDDDIALLGRAS